MTDRLTADTINSDALDQLYERLSTAETENAELRDALAHCHEREPRLRAEAAIGRVRRLAELWAKRTDQLKRGSELLAAALDGSGLVETDTGPAEPQHVTAGTPLICSDERHQAKVADLEQQLAALHEGEEPVTNPAVMHTPAQWIWRWNRATLEQRLQVVEAVMRDGATASDCRINGHAERIHDGRHAQMALNEVRQTVTDMENTTGARTWAGWLRDAMKRGPKHCLLCAVEPKPETGPAGAEVTEEQNLVHALGGDRTAKTIAHTLTVHGHTIDGVRTMTYAELLAVPGIGGPSLARIRTALDGASEPDGMDQAEPEEQPLTVPRSTATALHEVLGQLLGEDGAQAIGRVRALHHDWEADPGHCSHCTGPDGNLVRFPCPTIRALDGEEQPGA